MEKIWKAIKKIRKVRKARERSPWWKYFHQERPFLMASNAGITKDYIFFADGSLVEYGFTHAPNPYAGPFAKEAYHSWKRTPPGKTFVSIFIEVMVENANPDHYKEYMENRLRALREA